MNRLQREVFKLVTPVEKGLATPEQRSEFFSMVRDLTMSAVKKRARRLSGLAKFERTERRCVYPNGVHPKLAYLIEGEPEYDERRRLQDIADDMYQKERLKLCGD